MRINNMEIHQNKKYADNIIMCIAFMITVLVIITAGYIIELLVEDKLDIQLINNKYIQPADLFVAENSEKIQYISLTILFPIIYVCSFLVLKKCNIKLKNYKLSYDFWLTINLVLILGLFVWSIITGINGLFYKTTPKIIIISLLWISLIFLYEKLKSKKIIKYITYMVNILIICLVSYLYINATFEQSRYVSHHIDAYYYPILKIQSGLTPYVDFTPLYGCYSYVYVILQDLFCNNSFLFFSIINAILVGISLINLSIVTNNIIKNKVISLSVNLAIVFSIIIHCFLVGNGPYIQYMPHRVLFISIILLFITIYLKKLNSKRKNILQIIGFVISGFAIFWNIEIGLVVLIVWTVFLGYEILFYNSLKNKKTYIMLAKIIFMDVITIFLTCLSIMLITYIRTEEILNFKTVIASQLLFYKDGFNMIKMNLTKPWILLIYIYAIALALSLKKLHFISKEKRILFKKYAMIFVLSILGMGIFSYYQGRSHDHVYISVIYPGIILTGIFAEILLRRVMHIKRLHVSNAIILVISIISLSILATTCITSLLNSNNIKTYMDKNKLNSIKETNLYDFSGYDTSNMDFILEYESLYYVKYNLVDKKRFSAKVDLFTYNECEKILEYMELTDKNIAIDKDIYIIINKYSKGKKIIENKFKVQEEEKYMVLLNKNLEGEIYNE